MPCRTIEYGQDSQWEDIHNWLNERANPDSKVGDIVRDIIENVRTRGDEALVEYTRRFDCPDFSLQTLTVHKETIDAAVADIPESDLEILKESIANVTAFHEQQREKSWWFHRPDGSVLGQMVSAVDRVGLYVPGGQGGETPLISSIIMNGVPARVAGVREIAVFSPPRKDGTLNPYILATASLLGIEEVHLSGSAWAIAALAYGTDSVAPCDVIAGPGNIFVATAKAQLVGKVGIDMIAGPSEIAILADGKANPAWLAADMLSQAEHDALASSLLVTDDKSLADKVKEELKVQVEALPRSEIARKSLDDWGGIILVENLDDGVKLVNRIAPEHLELAVDDPWSLLGKVRHAGAIFMGHTAPEPVGDYFAGPNHVLPTLGNARFSSALSVQDFCKKSSVIATSEAFVQNNANKIARLARLEGLEAHARSVECRIKK